MQNAALSLILAAQKTQTVVGRDPEN